MSGILEIAPTRIPGSSLPRPAAAKNRSIARPAARVRAASGRGERSLRQSMFSMAARFFHRLAKTLRSEEPMDRVRDAAQDRAIAEQDSDIAAIAFIAKLSPVLGAARAAIREEAAMSIVPDQITVAQNFIATQPDGDRGARAAWWQTLPQLLPRLRRALQARVMPAKEEDAVLELSSARPAQWAFVPHAREFAVSRRRQSGGRIRSPRTRVPRS